MPANLPRRQHFIPQMILKHFADEKGMLWVGHRDKGHVFRQNRRKVFVQRDLYTRYPYSGGSPDAEYETRLSQIESEVSPILDRIINEVRDRRQPDLSPGELLTVQQFLFSLARRTPESQKRISRNQDAEEVFFQAATALPGYMEYVGRLDKDSLFAIEGVPALAKKVLHNVNADFAADNRADLIDELRRFCAETKLLFGLIDRSGQEFVIGSHGVTIVTTAAPARNHSLTVETCLPIAPDVIVEVVSIAQQNGLLTLTSTIVERINWSTLHLSRQIAGRSQSVVRSLITARQPFEPRSKGLPQRALRTNGNGGGRPGSSCGPSLDFA